MEYARFHALRASFPTFSSLWCVPSWHDHPQVRLLYSLFVFVVLRFSYFYLLLFFAVLPVGHRTNGEEPSPHPLKCVIVVAQQVVIFLECLLAFALNAFLARDEYWQGL